MSNEHPPILRQISVPVICDHCGHSSKQALNDDTWQALTDMGDYEETLEELALLERTERLFAEFPGSRHALEVDKEDSSVSPAFLRQLFSKPLGAQPEASEALTAEDAKFEQALQADPELHEFLKNTSFLLPARLKGVREALASYLSRLEQFRIACPCCGVGALHLECAHWNEESVATRRKAMFLFANSSAESLVGTIQDFGGAPNGSLLSWLYPRGANPLLFFGLIRDVAGWEMNMTLDAYDEWWVPLKRVLGSEPTLALSVECAGGEDAAKTLGRFAATVLKQHDGLVEDEVSKRSWRSEQFRSPTGPVVEFELWNG